MQQDTCSQLLHSTSVGARVCVDGTLPSIARYWAAMPVCIADVRPVPEEPETQSAAHDGDIDIAKRKTLRMLQAEAPQRPG